MSEITEKEKESSALAVLQLAMEKYSKAKSITYEETLEKFSESNTYGELFDFDSLLWTQGPDYLLALYEEEMTNREKAVS